MSFYNRDRFNGFGLTMASRLDTALVAQQPNEVYHAYSATEGMSLPLQALAMPQMLATAAKTPTPTKTAQQMAEEELALARKQQVEAETAAVVQETLDIGEPAGTPWLLYGGIGAGALALIGGALFFTRKKGKKVGGYRKRRRSRRRR